MRCEEYGDRTLSIIWVSVLLVLSVDCLRLPYHTPYFHLAISYQKTIGGFGPFILIDNGSQKENKLQFIYILHHPPSS